jgi:membrane protease YdiL (CAAX protease family)
MKSAAQKMGAILEVLLVVFVLVTLITKGANMLLPGSEVFQVEALGFPFPVFNHVAMVLAVVLVLTLAKRDYAAYGIHFRNVKAQLSIMAACFVPVVLANMPLGMGLDYTRWRGALVLAGTQIALLLVLGWLLRKKPNTAYALAGIGLLLSPVVSDGVAVAGKVLIVFLTYALFVGFGEEILYRGYVQSRLNEAFGKPYILFGVPVGWGLVIASLVFGLTHMGILRYLLVASDSLTWGWGFWTFFGGLVFGFVREKSGGILAPALLHGLPQAVASVVMLFF